MEFEATDSEGNAFYRKDGKWFKIPLYFEKKAEYMREVEDEQSVPVNIREEWERMAENSMASELMSESSVQMDDEDDEQQTPATKKMKAGTSSGSIISRSKVPKKQEKQKSTPSIVDPRKSASAQLPEKRKTKKQEKATSKANIDMEKMPYALITDSPQLIRPLRAELKARDPELARELFARLEIRKYANMSEKKEEEARKLKPYEPKSRKQTEKFYIQRDENRQGIQKCGEQMVADLERFKYQQKILSMEKKSEEELIPLSSIKHRGLRPEVCFKIEDLSDFAKSHGVTVLNLDKFICSTDSRKPIYTSKGQCIFCLTHGVKTNGHHPADQECPYKFCSCVKCYVAGKFGDRFEEFSLDYGDGPSSSNSNAAKD